MCLWQLPDTKHGEHARKLFKPMGNFCDLVIKQIHI